MEYGKKEDFVSLPGSYGLFNLSLQVALQEKIGYQGGNNHLRHTLKKLGFRWRKSQTNRSLLMERTDIVAARIQFLRKIKKYRENGRPIIYTDETFVHSSHTVSKSWQSSEVSLQAPFSRGERLIVLHAGSKAGFLKGTELVWKAKSSTGDYHDEMNGDKFFKWVKEKLIPHLPPKSVLIIDNAPYHNLQVDKCPTQASRKADIQAWLTRQQIPFGATQLKAKLLQICKQHKPTPSFLLDNILKEYGHDCLRLPAYHADLN